MSPTPTAIATPTALSVGEITGRVIDYRSTAALADVTLRADAVSATNTNVDGTYTFAGRAIGRTTLTLSKQANVHGVIAATDAVAVLQALNHERVLAPAARSACDVDGNGRLDRRDAEQILDLVIGSRARFDRAIACDSDWLFLPNPDGATKFDRDSIDAPCAGATIEVSTEPVEQDFAGIVVGDCNLDDAEHMATVAHSGALTTADARVGALRRTRARGMTLPLVIDATAAYTTAEIHVDFDPQVQPVRVRSRSRPSRLLVRFHADPAGSLTIAVASATPIAPEHPLTLIVELAPRDRTAPLTIPSPVPRVRVGE